jgi:uncharacterized protein YggE
MNPRTATLLLLAAAIAAPVAAQQPSTAAPTIRVSATGQARGTPDQAWIDLGIENTAPTAREAGEQNARAMERVIAAILRAGAARADVQTHDYNLFPEYVPPPSGNGEPVLRGYRAVNVVTVRTDRTREVGTLIDAALAAGANRANGVRFGMKNADVVHTQALQDAIRRARAEAETIAAGLGVRLGPVLDASTSVESPRTYEVAQQRMATMDKASTPVEPGEQTVTATVSLVYQIAR